MGYFYSFPCYIKKIIILFLNSLLFHSVATPTQVEVHNSEVVALWLLPRLAAEEAPSSLSLPVVGAENCSLCDLKSDLICHKV